MKVRFFKTSTGLVRSAVICLVGGMTGVSCFYQQCQAQQSSQPAQFSDPLKQINWISGPQSVNIGNIADINVPQGYRLTADAQGARFVLDTLNTAVPDDVVGVLVPDSGKGCVLLEYSPKGYVNDAAMAQLNAKSVLKSVKKEIPTQENGQAVTAMDWNMAPVYDSQARSLSWSLQVQTASSKTQNQGEVLLGRHGYIEMTAVESYPLAAAPDLKQLAANISFKPGERYSDYQSGDKLAEIGLAEVISGGKPANAAGIFSGGFGGAAAAWIYGGLALLTLGGLFVLRKKSRRHSVRSHVAVEVPAKVAVAAASVNEPLPAWQADEVKPTNGVLNGHAPAASPAARNGSKSLHRNRRKRVFDYSKFYTNVVKELTLHSYGGGTPVMNGKSRSNGHTNGHANGHTNGHANGYANGNGANGSGNPDLVKADIEQLIATQKHLIQEQKCLLEQQTKLIEEKRWLIQEQSTFLKGQADLIQDQQFPLKFE
jgi:MYXO-CTERM domain-containing protein